MPTDRLRPLLAFGAGGLAPLAFAPFQQSWLAPLALAVPFHLWLHARSVGEAARDGFLFGLGLFGFGVWWVFVSMNTYTGAGAAVASALTLLFVIVLALFPLLAGALSRWLADAESPPWRPVLIYPAAWVALEWLRGWIFTGFPWLQLGYSQTAAPLAGYLPLFGVLGASWIVALVAIVLVQLLERRPVNRWVAVAVMLWLAGAGLRQIDWSEPAGPPLKVSLLQGNIPQEMKWRPESRRQIVATYVEMTRRHWNADLIVWPETAIPYFYHQAKAGLIDPLQREAQRHGTDLLIGIPVKDRQGRYYNALVSLGKTPGMYFKRHLVPFGEYLPLRPLLGFFLDLIQFPMSDFTPGGDDQPPLRAAGHPLAPTICYEDAFARDTLRFLPRAAYIVNVSNDAWFGNTIAPAQHLQMAQARALEAGRYLLRATNTGLTAVIGPDGRIRAQAVPFIRTSLTETFVPLQGATPYVRWHDWPLMLTCLGLIGWGIWNTVRMKR